MDNDAPKRVPHFCDELTAKAFGVLFVEPGSGNEFFLSLRVKMALLIEALRGPSERPLRLA